MRSLLFRPVTATCSGCTELVVRLDGMELFPVNDLGGGFAMTGRHFPNWESG